MAGYTRQSAADIVPTAVVRAAPINNELNAVLGAFNASTGHKHDGTAAEGAPVPLIADADSNNKVVVDTSNNRVGVFVEVSTAPVEQVRFQDGAIVPVTDDDVDLGTASLKFKDLYIDGVGNIDSLVAGTADINGGTLDGVVIGGATPAAATFTTVSVNSSATIASADINAGTIDGAVIGGASAQAVTGTLITASTGFSGPLTGQVTGNVTGDLTGNVTGNVTGNLTGNVTAASGTSTFNNVTIAGTLDMDGATAATIVNLSSPTNTADAATKGYVDSADALKLNLSGGTMSGNIAMGTNKVTGLGTPTDSTDAATKVYVDNSVAALVDSAPGALDTLNELAAALGDDANFSTTVTNSLATKLALAGGTMTGAIAMGTSKITGLGDPTDNQDAATKVYVDTADALKLNLSGGTMSGAIAMGTSKITGLGDPTNTQDAATKTYVDTQDALKLSLTGGTMSGVIDMGSNTITTTHVPSGNSDLTNKLYIDTLFGSTVSAANSAAAAAISASEALISEGNAEDSAIAAAASASAASGSASNAEAAFDSFDDRYLGAKSSPPTLDNDGDALLTGALYFDTVDNELYVWNGSSWTQAALTAANFLLTTNNLSDLTSVTTAQQNLDLEPGVDIQAYSANLDSINQDLGTTDVALFFGLSVDTDTLFVNPVTNRIGIGTLAPSSQLTIESAAAEMTLNSTGSSYSRILFADNADGDIGQIFYDHTSDEMKFNTNNALNFKIGSDGNIDVPNGLITQSSSVVLDAGDIGVTVQAHDADTAKLDVAQSFTAAQTFTAGATLENRVKEKVTVSAIAATGTIDFDTITQSVLYYTTDASDDWTLNVRGDASNTLNSLMSTGQSLSIAFFVTQGATAYYQDVFTIDGSSVTPKWQGGTAPTSGNASSIDVYFINIIKTADATFTALASQTQFA